MQYVNRVLKQVEELELLFGDRPEEESDQDDDLIPNFTDVETAYTGQGATDGPGDSGMLFRTDDAALQIVSLIHPALVFR